jgi:hypothetical protein
MRKTRTNLFITRQGKVITTTMPAWLNTALRQIDQLLIPAALIGAIAALTHMLIR